MTHDPTILARHAGRESVTHEWRHAPYQCRLAMALVERYPEGAIEILASWTEGRESQVWADSDLGEIRAEFLKEMMPLLSHNYVPDDGPPEENEGLVRIMMAIRDVASNWQSLRLWYARRKP